MEILAACSCLFSPSWNPKSVEADDAWSWAVVKLGNAVWSDCLDWITAGRLVGHCAITSSVGTAWVVCNWQYLVATGTWFSQWGTLISSPRSSEKDAWVCMHGNVLQRQYEMSVSSTRAIAVTICQECRPIAVPIPGCQGCNFYSILNAASPIDNAAFRPC